MYKNDNYFFSFFFVNLKNSENMVSDRISDRKVANIAASLVAAAATANGSIDEKERELNEVITGLQILREELIRRVSYYLIVSFFQLSEIFSSFVIPHSSINEFHYPNLRNLVNIKLIFFYSKNWNILIWWTLFWKKKNETFA